MQIRDPKFIALKVAHALNKSKALVESFTKMSEHHAGAEIIRLYTQDCLGPETSHSGTFEAKHTAEFRERNATSTELKIGLGLFVVLIDLFLILVCISYGNDRGKNWQLSWLLAVILKIALDIFFSQFAQGLIVGYTVPNLLIDDLALVRSKLLRSGEKIITSKSPYKFHRFSSSDYTFVSTLVAKQLPHLLESKLILMHRDHIPERIVQKRFKYWNTSKKAATSFKSGSLHALYFSLIQLALAFGSIQQDIQSLVIFVIPSAVFLCMSWFFILIYNIPALFYSLLLIVMVSFVIFLAIWFKEHMLYRIDAKDVKSSDSHDNNNIGKNVTKLNKKSRIVAPSPVAESTTGQDFPIDVNTKIDLSSDEYSSDDDDSDSDGDYDVGVSSVPGPGPGFIPGPNIKPMLQSHNSEMVTDATSSKSQDGVASAAPISALNSALNSAPTVRPSYVAFGENVASECEDDDDDDDEKEMAVEIRVGSATENVNQNDSFTIDVTKDNTSNIADFIETFDEMVLAKNRLGIDEDDDVELNELLQVDISSIQKKKKKKKKSKKVDVIEVEDEDEKKRSSRITKVGKKIRNTIIRRNTEVSMDAYNTFTEALGDRDNLDSDQKKKDKKKKKEKKAKEKKAKGKKEKKGKKAAFGDDENDYYGGDGGERPEPDQSKKNKKSRKTTIIGDGDGGERPEPEQSKKNKKSRKTTLIGDGDGGERPEPDKSKRSSK